MSPLPLSPCCRKWDPPDKADGSPSQGSPLQCHMPADELQFASPGLSGAVSEPASPTWRHLQLIESRRQHEGSRTNIVADPLGGVMVSPVKGHSGGWHSQASPNSGKAPPLFDAETGKWVRRSASVEPTRPLSRTEKEAPRWGRSHNLYSTSSRSVPAWGAGTLGGQRGPAQRRRARARGRAGACLKRSERGTRSERS